MKILIGDQLFDSTKEPVLLVFDEAEKVIFNGMNRFVSAPEESNVEQRQRLIDTDISKYEKE